jgi:manganese transport protein
MGKFAIKPFTIVLASLITALLVYLNIRMVWEQASTFFITSDSFAWKALIIFCAIGYITLLITAIVYPLLKNKRAGTVPPLHADASSLLNIKPPVYKKIAVALDFSSRDQRIIAHAIGQRNEVTELVLIHIVESAPTRLMGKETDDLETRRDMARLQEYVIQLQQQGIKAEGFLGFNERVKEIVRIVKEQDAEMLVIGGHGHSGLKDLLYGQTIGGVRHGLKIPVLVVS